MASRRQFIKQIGIGTAILQASRFPFHALIDDVDITKVTILHTNDVHSRIDPFPEDGSRNAGLGGAAKRASLIKAERSKSEHVLLFDSGDIFQGTPYFNFYGGELEMKLMTAMQYDGATMGNHDFDGGIDGFSKQLAHADFPILIANYQFDNTVLNGKTSPYKIYLKGGIKFGVFGLGIELNGLVPKTLYGDTIYNDPIQTAKNTAQLLKEELKCDYVICLSHLGYKYEHKKISDMVLASSVNHIDLILGGHTHTFLDEPTVVLNPSGHEVVINQCGWAGIVLGKIELYFEKNKKGKCVSCKNILIK